MKPLTTNSITADFKIAARIATAALLAFVLCLQPAQAQTDRTSDETYEGHKVSKHFLSYTEFMNLNKKKQEKYLLGLRQLLSEMHRIDPEYYASAPFLDPQFDQKAPFYSQWMIFLGELMETADAADSPEIARAKRQAERRAEIARKNAEAARKAEQEAAEAQARLEKLQSDAQRDEERKKAAEYAKELDAANDASGFTVRQIKADLIQYGPNSKYAEFERESVRKPKATWGGLGQTVCAKNSSFSERVCDDRAGCYCFSKNEVRAMKLGHNPFESEGRRIVEDLSRPQTPATAPTSANSDTTSPPILSPVPPPEALNPVPPPPALGQPKPEDVFDQNDIKAPNAAGTVGAGTSSPSAGVGSSAPQAQEPVKPPVAEAKPASKLEVDFNKCEGERSREKMAVLKTGKKSQAGAPGMRAKCVFAGNISNYTVFRSKKKNGNLVHTKNSLCEIPNTSRVNDSKQKLGCSSGGNQVACNPLLFGTEGGQALCVGISKTATKECHEKSKGDLSSAVEYIRNNPQSWARFGAELESFCQEASVTQKYFLCECQVMMGRLKELKDLAQGKVTPPSAPEPVVPAAPPAPVEPVAPPARPPASAPVEPVAPVAPAKPGVLEGSEGETRVLPRAIGR